MYGDKMDTSTGEEYRDTSNPTGHQLLLNYCFGHNASSMLLCPYGHETGMWFFIIQHTIHSIIDIRRFTIAWT